jgi:membrane-bound lytic murein transglycosylase D
MTGKVPKELLEEDDIPDLDAPVIAEASPPEQGGAVGEEMDVDLEPQKIRKKRQIPFEFNQKVASWVEYFSQKDRERFQRFFDRGEPYREVIQNILEENGVPTDLYYLGMIESGFTLNAKSSAQAVGVWQFMRATGRMYGLRSDHYVDQRMDPIRATEAAARMLRDLYRDFRSWYLAMAAYNAGPGRIRSAIRKAKTNDFWELVERRMLPRETMEYVPKFLAARYIGENPDLFAFYINEETRYPDVELVRIPSPVPFTTLERACSMPEGTLSFVNPHYLRGHTHPAKVEDEIWVPEPYLKQVEAKRRDLASLVIRVKPVRAGTDSLAGVSRVQMYTVRGGDTLKSIARKRGLSVAYLKRVNGLRSSSLMPGQRLKLSASSYHQKKSHPRKKSRRRSGR